MVPAQLRKSPKLTREKPRRRSRPQAGTAMQCDSRSRSLRIPDAVDICSEAPPGGDTIRHAQIGSRTRPGRGSVQVTGDRYTGTPDLFLEKCDGVANCLLGNRTLYFGFASTDPAIEVFEPMKSVPMSLRYSTTFRAGHDYEVSINRFVRRPQLKRRARSRSRLPRSCRPRHFRTARGRSAPMSLPRDPPQRRR